MDEEALQKVQEYKYAVCTTGGANSLMQNQTSDSYVQMELYKLLLLLTLCPCISRDIETNVSPDNVTLFPPSVSFTYLDTFK